MIEEHGTALETGEKVCYEENTPYLGKSMPPIGISGAIFLVIGFPFYVWALGTVCLGLYRQQAWTLIFNDCSVCMTVLGWELAICALVFVALSWLDLNSQRVIVTDRRIFYTSSQSTVEQTDVLSSILRLIPTFAVMESRFDKTLSINKEKPYGMSHRLVFQILDRTAVTEENATPIRERQYVFQDPDFVYNQLPNYLKGPRFKWRGFLSTTEIEKRAQDWLRECSVKNAEKDKRNQTDERIERIERDESRQKSLASSTVHATSFKNALLQEKSAQSTIAQSTIARSGGVPSVIEDTEVSRAPYILLTVALIAVPLYVASHPYSPMMVSITVLGVFGVVFGQSGFFFFVLAMGGLTIASKWPSFMKPLLLLAAVTSAVGILTIAAIAAVFTFNAPPRSWPKTSATVMHIHYQSIPDGVIGNTRAILTCKYAADDKTIESELATSEPICPTGHSLDWSHNGSVETKEEHAKRMEEISKPPCGLYTRSRYRNGDNVIVRYDPEHPQTAILETWRLVPDIFMLLKAGTVGLFNTFIGLNLLFRCKTRLGGAGELYRMSGVG